MIETEKKKIAMIVTTLLLIAGAICAAGALVCVLRPWCSAALPAYAALCLLNWSTSIYLPVKTFVFWGVATVICLGLRHMSPKGEPDGRNTGNVYVGLGAMAGGLLGILVSARIMVLGVVVGALMGQLAFSKTPHGKWLKFPSSTFIHYFCAKSLPAIVATAMVGIAVEGFIL